MVQDSIGHGAFSEVVKAKVVRALPDAGLQKGDVVAIKILHKGRPGVPKKLLETLRMEANILRVLNKASRSRFPKVHEVWEDSRHLFMAQEVMQGGELFDHLVKMDHYNEDIASYIFRDLLKAIAVMHKCGVIHRDIKPENILFSTAISERCCPTTGNGGTTTGGGGIGGGQEDDAVEQEITRKANKGRKVFDVPYCFDDEGRPVKPKIIDLGMAEIKDNYANPEKPIRGICGSAGFIAPETIKGEAHGTPMDVYSAGVVLFMMLTGTVPYGNDISQACKYADIPIEDAVNVKKGCFANLSSDAKDILFALLQPDPSRRVNAEDALTHPWVMRAASNMSLMRVASYKDGPSSLKKAANLAREIMNIREKKGQDINVYMPTDTNEESGLLSLTQRGSKAGSVLSGVTQGGRHSVDQGSSANGIIMIGVEGSDALEVMQRQASIFQAKKDLEGIWNEGSLAKDRNKMRTYSLANMNKVKQGQKNLIKPVEGDDKIETTEGIIPVAKVEDVK